MKMNPASAVEVDAERLRKIAEADCGCRIPYPFDEVADHLASLAEAEGFKRGLLAQPTSASDDREGLVERLREALVTLDVFLAGYSSEPDTDVVRNLPDEDLLTWGDLRQIHAVLDALSTPKPATSEVDLREAIRKAKLMASKKHGIDWRRLEEISQVELILAALAGKDVEP